MRPHLGVEACRRLVEQDNLGVADCCDGQTQPPLHAATEAAHLVLFLGEQADKGKNLIDLIADLGRLDSFEARKHVEVVVGSELVPEYVELRADSYVLPDLVDILDVIVIDDDLRANKLVRSNHSREDIDESCFSCSVVAQNPH